MAATLPISFACYLYKLALFFVLYRVKMLSKQVLWIYVSVFLSLTLCTTRVYSQTTKCPPKGKASYIYKIEVQMAKFLSMVVNGIDVVEQRLEGGNEMMKKTLTSIFSTVSMGPSSIVNQIIIIETTVFGKVTEGAAFVLKNAGMQKQGMMVENLGKSLKTCYNDNKQNVFKTAIVSIPTCIGQGTTGAVELATADLNAFQVIVLDLEAYVKKLEDCDKMACYRTEMGTLAGKLRGDIMNWAKTRAMMLMTIAEMLPKSGACFGEKTGINTGQQLVTVIKGFGSCVMTEAKK